MFSRMEDAGMAGSVFLLRTEFIQAGDCLSQVWDHDGTPDHQTDVERFEQHLV